MPVETLPVDVLRPATQDALAETPPHSTTPTFEERWAAWQARGAAHDRAVRRRVTIAAPILAVAAAILYALLLR
jgi:hypothetical protein